MSGSKKRSGREAFGLNSEHDLDSDNGSSSSNKNIKRLVWSELLHQDFISVIFDLGLRSITLREIPQIENALGGYLTRTEVCQHLREYMLLRKNHKDLSSAASTNDAVLPGQYAQGLHVAHITMQGQFIKNFLRTEFGAQYMEETSLNSHSISVSDFSSFLVGTDDAENDVTTNTAKENSDSLSKISDEAFLGAILKDHRQQYHYLSEILEELKDGLLMSTILGVDFEEHVCDHLQQDLYQQQQQDAESHPAFVDGQVSGGSSSVMTTFELVDFDM